MSASSLCSLTNIRRPESVPKYSKPEGSASSSSRLSNLRAIQRSVLNLDLVGDGGCSSRSSRSSSREEHQQQLRLPNISNSNSSSRRGSFISINGDNSPKLPLIQVSEENSRRSSFASNVSSVGSSNGSRSRGDFSRSNSNTPSVSSRPVSPKPISNRGSTVASRNLRAMDPQYYQLSQALLGRPMCTSTSEKNKKEGTIRSRSLNPISRTKRRSGSRENGMPPEGGTPSSRIGGSEAGLNVCEKEEFFTSDVPDAVTEARLRLSASENDLSIYDNNKEAKDDAHGQAAVFVDDHQLPIQGGKWLKRKGNALKHALNLCHGGAGQPELPARQTEEYRGVWPDSCDLNEYIKINHNYRSLPQSEINVRCMPFEIQKQCKGAKWLASIDTKKDAVEIDYMVEQSLFGDADPAVPRGFNAGTNPAGIDMIPQTAEELTANLL